jgi:hypothetical protein
MLSTCQTLSFLLIFLFPDPITVLLCRFLSGISSNLLLSSRKLLQSVLLKEETNELSLFRVALISNRSGLASGAVLGSLLFNSYFLPFPIEKKLVILSILLFFLSLLSIFAGFLLKSPLFFVNEHKNRYAELPEIKIGSEVSDSERNSKETNDSNNLFSTAILANYHPEESLGREDVKYYSPRAVVNKESVPKMIQSARPKLGASFDFPENEHHEDDYHESQEDYDKKVHISFIDEEFENEDTCEKNDEAVNKTQTSTQPPVLPEKILKTLAFKVRIMVSVSVGVLFEVVPVSAYVKLSGKGQDFVLMACGISAVVAFIVFQVVSERIMEKVQVYQQVVVFSLVGAGVLGLFPVLDVMAKDPVILIPFWVLSLFLAEALAPTGVVLLADSAVLAEREKEILESNFYCAGFKACSSYFAVAFTAAGAWNSLSMVVLAMPLVITGYFGNRFKEIWVQQGFKT